MSKARIARAASTGARRVRNTGVAAVALALLTGAAAAPADTRLSWLPELAGRCWHQRDFGTDVCYWQSAPGRLAFLTRNRSSLLECGELRVSGRAPGELDVTTWDAGGGAERLPVRIDDRVLSLIESVGTPDRPGRIVSEQSRPRAGRFTIVKRRDDARTTSSPLTFERGAAFRPSNADARRCSAWRESAGWRGAMRFSAVPDSPRAGRT